MGLLDSTTNHNFERMDRPKRRIIVSEFPFPDSLCVPGYLNLILPIDRSLDKLIENIGHDKLRFFQHLKGHYRVKRVTEDAEIDRLDATMIRPFASSRYTNPHHYQISWIRRIARKTGTLNLIYFDDKEVACSLGSETVRKGKRYWIGQRSGFPEGIFANGKLFSEANRMNYYLEIVWACLHHYDYYVLGTSLARPEDKVLQWKRRIRGNLDTMGNNDYFYIRPPKTVTSDFFWEAPRFSLENGKITLNLGKPRDQSDEAFIKRFKEMGFGGLSKICLHCELPPSENILSTIYRLYDRFESRPAITIEYQG